MKDLILIPTYAPDSQRKEILRNFVKSINREVFDFMVVSHSSIPTDIIENTDYFLYDAKNILLTDIKYKYTMYYHNEKMKVVSTENRPFNHFLAALKLVTLGLSMARNEGYIKVHCIEYDTELNSDIEFLDNSVLLEKYSLVYYIEVGDQKSNEPGILKLFYKEKEILQIIPSNGTIVIFPADQIHSAAYNGKKDRIMIGINFYGL